MRYSPLRTNLRRLRLEHGFSQQKLADAANVSRATIAGIEGGRYPGANTSTVVGLARALGEPVEALLVAPLARPAAKPAAR